MEMRPTDQENPRECRGWSGDPAHVAVLIPTLNAGPHIDAQLAALRQQGLPPSSYLVIDSQSTDGSAERYRAFGAEVVMIDRRTFNHGGTRRFAVTLRPDARFLVMMTQDAIPADAGSVHNLLSAFENPLIGMAYGRQLPRPGAGAIERHARLFNYPDSGQVRSLEDCESMGVKTVFCSNSYAAYRRSALEEVGSFPYDAFFAEDQIVAGKMMLAGWKLAYRADAPAIHSHGYSVIEDFRRYFDVGVYHGRNRWLIDSFGKAEGEGLRFLISEMRYLWRNEPQSIPSAAARTIAKYMGYRLGQIEVRLPIAWKRRLSMQPSYWRRGAG